MGTRYVCSGDASIPVYHWKIIVASIASRYDFLT